MTTKRKRPKNRRGPITAFMNALTRRQYRAIAGLTTPEKIQEYLDRVQYCGEDDGYHCPLTLVQTKAGCCFAGALFGALALSRLGHRPLVVELKSEFDDDHEIAVYRDKGCWGAVAKSHCKGLRSREPVYRSLRELAMSYFEHYYNHRRQRTLRSYSLPLDLRRFEGLDWMISEEGMTAVAAGLDSLRHVPLFPPRRALRFSKADIVLVRCGVMG